MKRPQGRTLAEFGALSEAETALLSACERGGEAVVGIACPESVQAENAVRADFVAFLAMGGDENAPVHHRGVRLQGAWIDGDLDISGASVPYGLHFNKCYLAGARPNLCEVEINGSLSLTGCETKGMALDSAVVNGNVLLNGGFKASGKVSLVGSELVGTLECTDAALNEAESDRVLSLDHAVIHGSVFLNGAFKAKGEVWLLGVKVKGSLECSDAQLDGDKGNSALVLDRATVNGDVFLNGSFKTNGEIRMVGARIGGNLDCRGAALNSSDGGSSLSLDGSVVDGSIFLNQGFTARGEIRLLGVQLSGDLYCIGSQLDRGRSSSALVMDSATVKGDVRLVASFKARGTVRLLGAQVGGDFDCSGAQLDDGKEGVALVMDGAQVAGTWFLTQLTSPLSGVSLSGCRVGRLVDEPASWGSNLVLDGFVYAQLAGTSPADAPSRLAWLRKQAVPVLGSPSDSGGFNPQPWLQLQRVLREMGHLEDARQVAIALEDHRREIGLVGQTPNTWNTWRRIAYSGTSVFLHWAFKILIGYGYRPLRLVGWMFLVWIFSAAVFWFAALQGAMGPGNPLVFNDPKLRAACADNWYLCSDLPEEYTGFSPLAYSLDVLLPLVNLEQEKDWAPLIPTPKPSWWEEWLTNWSLKHVARLVVWAEILFGWIASLLLVAVFSGLAKRREE